MPALELPTSTALPADWRDIFALTKPRVMSLVVFTGLAGLLAAPVMPPLVIGFTAILCIALGAGAAGRSTNGMRPRFDGKMRRTAKRPLPAGRMDRADGASFRGRAGGLFGSPDGACRELSGGHPAGRFDPVLRPRLHRVAEAPDGAEYRHRRCCRRRSRR